jgi:hypothetical protein
VSSVALHTRVLQGGNELCRIEGFDRRTAVSELKVSIEAEAGLVSALTRLVNPESHVELQDHHTLEDAGTHQGVIQLYAQKLKKVVVADELQIAPGEVTDRKLASFCDSIKDDPPDVLILCGCHRVTNISCLVQLSMISHLDISGCSGCSNLGAKGGCQLADVIKEMGALSVLSLKSNGLGPAGGKALAEGLKGNQVIAELNIADNYLANNGDVSGVIALADAIPDMGALTKFDISDNSLCAAGAKVLAEALRHNQVMTEINIANNHLGNCQVFYCERNTDMSGAAALANVIPGMGALTQLDLSSNALVGKTWNDSKQDYDFDVSGYLALADALPKCQ